MQILANSENGLLSLGDATPEECREPHSNDNFVKATPTSFKEGVVTNVKGEKIAFKQWTYAPDTKRSCNRLEEIITLYADGFFQDEYLILNSGDKSISFNTLHAIYEKKEHPSPTDPAFEDWNWEKEAEPGVVTTASLAGLSEALRENFNKKLDPVRWERCIHSCNSR